MMALIALLTSGLREMTDDQFADLLATMRRELAPTTALEGFLVERVLIFAGRLRKAARLEDSGASLSSIWLRYEAMAERGFWKALNAIEKGRKARGKAREKAPAVLVEVATEPPPAPLEPAAEATSPAPTPSSAPVASSSAGIGGPNPLGYEDVPRPPATKPVPPSPTPPSAPVPAPKPAPAPASAAATRLDPKLLKALGKRRPPAPKLPPFPPALPGGDLLHLSITSKPPKHRVDDLPMPFEI